MTFKTVMTCGCVAAILVASAADAQSRRQLMQQIDINGDGLIQFAELRAFRARAFDEIDTNNDGIANASELAALQERAASSGRLGPANLDPFSSDANGDGVITRQEFASYIPPRTLSADANRDGALSRSEMRALR